MKHNIQNSTIASQLLKVVDVIIELTSHGLLVEEVKYDLISRPTITIEHHPYCKKMIDGGSASYYMSGPDESGLYQMGHFTVLGCRVVWKERLTNRLH